MPFNKIIDIFDNSQELSKDIRSKHIVYKYKNSAVAYINKTSSKVIIGFHKGYLLENTFYFIKGNSKYIRHLHFTSFKQDDKKLLVNIINQSITTCIELQEKKNIIKLLK